MTPKNILITGSTGRLGRIIAQRFINLGHVVVGLDRSTDSNLEWPIIQVDVTDPDAVERGFDLFCTQFGKPDVVIHTVGYWNMSSLGSTTLSDWNTLLDLNLTSSFLVFRESVRRMDNSGCLIAFSSRQGAVKGAGEQAGYSAAKAGLIRLVESIASEYAATPLQAHVIAASTILFDPVETGGVQASELASMCVALCSNPKEMNQGPFHEAFGDG